MSEKQDLKRFVIYLLKRYDIISLFFPFLITICVYYYQKIKYTEFVGSLNMHDEANRNAIALFSFSQGIELIIALIVACFIGLILAIIWIKTNKHRLEIAKIGIFLNGIPLIIAVIFIILKIFNE